MPPHTLISARFRDFLDQHFDKHDKPVSVTFAELFSMTSEERDDSKVVVITCRLCGESEAHDFSDQEMDAIDDTL